MSLFFLQIPDPELPNVMVKDDPLDNENPRSHTANNIHVVSVLLSLLLRIEREYIHIQFFAVICLLVSTYYFQDNKREEMSIMVSSVNDEYKTAALDFQKDKTTTDRPRLQGQASVRVATPT